MLSHAEIVNIVMRGRKRCTPTSNGVDVGCTITKGGYSSSIVVHQRIPDSCALALAAPLLCAGLTVFTPMKRYIMNQPGVSLGVIGLGGLDHSAVKLGKAFDNMSKREEALNILGADNFVASSDEQQMADFRNSLDFVVDTASGDHLFDLYISLLKIAGIFILVGFPGMRTISGSRTGGTKDTQELDFCAANKIYPQVELVPIQYANAAIDRLIKGDIRYRFVLDIEISLK